jgi:G3E family GTPase
VLVNEVAALDVDGQLLSTSQSNAAAGIKAAQLAGGCACCSVSGDLQAALHELAGSSSYQQLDYLVGQFGSCEGGGRGWEQLQVGSGGR